MGQSYLFLSSSGDLESSSADSRYADSSDSKDGDDDKGTSSDSESSDDDCGRYK